MLRPGIPSQMPRTKLSPRKFAIGRLDLIAVAEFLLAVSFSMYCANACWRRLGEMEGDVPMLPHAIRVLPNPDVERRRVIADKPFPQKLDEAIDAFWGRERAQRVDVVVTEEAAPADRQKNVEGLFDARQRQRLRR